MSVANSTAHLLGSTSLLMQVIAAAIAFGLAAYVYFAISAESKPIAGFPVISLPGLGPKESYLRDGNAVIAKGLDEYKGKVFQIVTGIGPKLVVPNRYVEELKASDALDLNEAVMDEFFPTYPGFIAARSALHDPIVVPTVVRTRLTQSLGLVTTNLVEEATDAIERNFPHDKEWKTVAVKTQVMDVVGRLMSRVMLGKPLCRNERWLEIMKGYTTNMFMAMQDLRKRLNVTRFITQYWSGPCTVLRKEARDAHAIINPEVKRRVANMKKALAEGKRSAKVSDTIGWMVEIAVKDGRYKPDYAGAQLLLSVAGTHSTTEATTQVLIMLCEHPEIIPMLRKEITEVIGTEGWSKGTIGKLKIMDSFLKETQRFRPSGLVAMQRFVRRPFPLSDGTVLPAKAKIQVLGEYFDPEVYENPKEFDALRFLKMAERDQQSGEKKDGWQFVQPSRHHLGFGFGEHSCPGRFFASSEIRIVVAHLVMKYDWKFTPGGAPRQIYHETLNVVDPGAQLMVRRRTPEFDVDKVVLEDL